MIFTIKNIFCKIIYVQYHSTFVATKYDTQIITYVIISLMKCVLFENY